MFFAAILSKIAAKSDAFAASVSVGGGKQQQRNAPSVGWEMTPCSFLLRWPSW